MPSHHTVLSSLLSTTLVNMRILRSGCQCIGVGLGRGAGRYAEEAVLRVHGPKSAVGADPQPGDIVAHRPDLIALASDTPQAGISMARLVLPQAEGNAAVT